MNPEQRKAIAQQRARVDQMRASVREYFAEHEGVLGAATMFLRHETHEQGAAIGRELHGMPAPMRALVIRLANIGLASVLESAIDAEAEQ